MNHKPENLVPEPIEPHIFFSNETGKAQRESSNDGLTKDGTDGRICVEHGPTDAWLYV